MIRQRFARSGCDDGGRCAFKRNLHVKAILSLARAASVVKAIIIRIELVFR